MNVGFLNVNSINSDVRSTALCELIKSENIEVMAIAETKIPYNKSMKNNSSCPNGYKMYHKARKNSIMGGGVGLILSNKFTKVKMRDDFAAMSFEYLRMNFTYERTSFDVTVIYRPPGSEHTQSQFIYEFNSYLEFIGSSSLYKLILGDFNFHVDLNDRKSNLLSTMISDNDFENIIHVPTHRGGHTLDLVLVPKGQNSGFFDVHPELTFSDHYVVLGTVPVVINSTKIVKECISRPFKRAKIDEVNKIVDEILTDDGDILNFNLLLKNMTDDNFPLIKSTFISRLDKPWFNTSIVSARRERRKLERKFRKSRSAESELNYVNQRKEVNKLISSTKYNYFTHLFKEAGRDSKEIFRILNLVNGLDNDVVLPSLAKIDPKNCATFFFNFFDNKIENFQSHINERLLNSGTSNLECFESEVRSNTFCKFMPINLKECIDIFNRCRKTYVPDLDCTNFKIFSENPEVICKYLYPIINKCLEIGKYPETENRGVIRPKIKGDNLDCEDPNAYRPITLSPFVGKMIDNTMYIQMEPFIASESLLPDCQSSYQKCHSTETAVAKINNDIIKSFVNKKSVAMLLLDLSAAFDTIDQEILVSDLCECGFRDDALKLLRSYITERQVAVSINGSLSEFRHQKYGTAQGSTLGPRIFILYMRGIRRIFEKHNVSYHLYADDTAVYIEFDESDALETKQKLINLMNDIYAWMLIKKLKLNMD